jgi:hypothetical protein
MPKNRRQISPFRKKRRLFAYSLMLRDASVAGTQYNSFRLNSLKAKKLQISPRPAQRTESPIQPAFGAVRFNLFSRKERATYTV